MKSVWSDPHRRTWLVVTFALAASYSSRAQSGLFQGVGPSAVLSTGYPAVIPRGVLLADVTGDGVTDAIVGSAYANRIDVFPGNGQGVFASAVTTVVPIPPGWGTVQLSQTPIAAIDLDSDGVLDLVTVADYGLQVHVNLGSGTFLSSPPIPGSLTPNSYVALKDLNGDGNIEIVQSGTPIAGGPSILRVFSKLPGLQFTMVFDSTTTSLVMSSGPVTCLDVNGDTHLDIVYVDFLPGPIIPVLKLLLVSSNLVLSYGGAFAIPPPAGCACSVGAGPLFSCDVTGDGWNEVVLKGSTGPPYPIIVRIWVYPIAGGTLATPTIQSTSGFAGGTLLGQEPSLADFDLDGCPELLFPQPTLSSPDIFRLLPGFGFGGTTISLSSEYVPWQFGVEPMYVSRGDIDGDGDDDLAYVRWTQNPGTGPTTVTVSSGLNQTLYRHGCQPGSSASLGVGTPALGNPAFGLSLTGPPNSAAALGFSQSSGFNPVGSCIVWLDLAPGALLLPVGALGITTTDGAGVAQLTFSIPSTPSLLGTDYFLQWIVVDPTGPINLLGSNYSLSAARRVLLW